MKTPADTTIVALFVRLPVPGRVKTRLAAALGTEEACRLYRAMVTDILSTVGSSGFPLWLFHDGGTSSVLPRAWVEAASTVVAQQGASIGERMMAAFEHCFAEGIGQVLLLGSDIPGLDAELLNEAAKALTTRDVAIAPALDGGYGLIALKRATYRRRLFQDIPWSTARVLTTTLAKFRECQLEARLLRNLQDLDTLDDLQTYWKAPCPHARATNSLIAELFQE
jgi:rSAM/selenodomain-associated transferase 1